MDRIPASVESRRPKAAPSRPDFGLGDIIKLWNFIAARHGLPLTQRRDDQRGSSFRKMARLEPRLSKKQPWKEYFKLIAKSPELNGTASPTFRATLDWALSRRNYHRVYAGEFSSTQSESGSSRPI